MSACGSLNQLATAGVAPALRAVDCLANDVTASSFGRLFGAGGALLPALTIVLTLYIAVFAVSLLTGRSRVGVAALTPRMTTLGLVLTFATSSVAYQEVVWNLAIGAPDQVASVLMGAKGSATELFAERIDMVVGAIADVASTTGVGQGPSQAAAAAASGSFSPGNLMWLSAMLVLLGTVGVLVTARIALAVLLALGPVFVVFTLFKSTHGLFAGWIRGVVLTAVAPLFAVLGGSVMLELALPVISGLRSATGIEGRAAMALFLVAAVYIALLAMVLRVVAAMIAGWSVFGLTSDCSGEGGGRQGSAVGGHSALAGDPAAAPARRSLGMLVTPAPTAVNLDHPGPAIVPDRVGHALAPPIANQAPVSPRQRAQGIGSRFAAPARAFRETAR